MKLQIIIVFLFGVYLSCSNKPDHLNTKNDWSRQNLQGKVKSLNLTICYDIDSLGKFNKNCQKVVLQKTLFNENGNIVKDIDFSNLNGYTYEYDNNGNLIEETEYDTGFKNIFTKKTYEYDNNGNIVKASLFNMYGSKPINQYNYSYDDKGNLIEKTCLDIGGKIIDIIKYKHDNNGNQIEEESYDSNNILGLKNKYKYDTIGNNIEFCQFNSKDSLINKTEYSYDKFRNIIELKNYLFSENSKGTNIFRKFKYEYDTQGNWVKKMGFLNNVMDYVQIREFEYY